MNRQLRQLIMLIAALASLVSLAFAAPAHACGEGRFSSGGGLAYQEYLAPRPAVVLIHDDTSDAGREQLYAALQRAGHKVTVVHDAAALTQALAAGGGDVVIGTLDVVAALPPGRAHALPVVGRDQRDAARDRFGAALAPDASLAQYLKGIHRALAFAR